MRLCSIASGSSGNCTYIGSDATHLIVDAGISAKRIEEGLKDLELTPKDLDGILITHEHSDHVAGLAVLSKKYEIPLYATEGTREAILKSNAKNVPDRELFVTVKADENLVIKDLNVCPMHISHDAADPVGYRFRYGNLKAAVCTDIGVFNEYTVECLKDMDALLIEANHDVNMLQVGPYPYYLKQRILGNRGHLSNENAGRLLDRVISDKLKGILLGHLSKENNMPELAYESVRFELQTGQNAEISRDIPLYVAPRNALSQTIHL
ncbi:MAG: MBL fold metallo-hydrolase [Lachnospiraceae bacterium]